MIMEETPAQCYVDDEITITATVYDEEDVIITQKVEVLINNEVVANTSIDTATKKQTYTFKPATNGT
ncbi:MAG: hypothetical protein BZ136_09610, partial [Methanosphaera sp. rholeuAM74]